MGGDIIHAEGMRFAFHHPPEARKTFRLNDEFHARDGKNQLARAGEQATVGFAQLASTVLAGWRAVPFYKWCWILLASKVGSFLPSAEEQRVGINFRSRPRGCW